jgi:hypothetical protein
MNLYFFLAGGTKLAGGHAKAAMANHAAPHKLMYAKAALGCALCILGKESE